MKRPQEILLKAERKHGNCKRKSRPSILPNTVIGDQHVT